VDRLERPRRVLAHERLLVVERARKRTDVVFVAEIAEIPVVTLSAIRLLRSRGRRAGARESNGGDRA
jgi:hypothetical protein